MQEYRFSSGWWVILFLAMAGLIYWRAQTTGHVWELLGALALAVVMLAFGSSMLLKRGDSWWGCSSLTWGILMSAVLVYFLFTGDYWRALSMVGIRPTPTPIVVTATPEALAAAPPPASTRSPTAAPVPTSSALARETPAPSATTQPKTGAWWQADPTYAQPVTPEAERWRLYATIFLAVEYVILIWARARTAERNVGWGVMSTIVVGLLAFTKVGQWLYQIFLWAFALGPVAKGLFLLLGALSGLAGVGNVTALVIGGYVYHDMDVLFWILLPSMIISVFALIPKVWRAGHYRVPKWA
jgi:hypothetical protein